MSIVLTGLSHNTAPVEMRERLAVPEEKWAERLRALVDGEVVREGLVVSTCNRVEVLASVEPGRDEEGLLRVGDFLAAGARVSYDEFRRHLYTHRDGAAVRHVFRVASSLDSMVVGDAQILGQVRQAYTRSVEAGTAGRVMHRLMHHAFHAAKRVRTETGVATSAVSVSYAAVELGRKILETLEGRTVLVVGAGEMAVLAARHLTGAGASRVLFTNRTHETAQKLAVEFGGEAVVYENFGARLPEADVVIVSTGAQQYIVTPEMARAASTLRRNRPAFYIDISVPRNVDPKVGELGNLFVFDIDDLEAVIASNIREREKEAERAELIVEAEVEQFQQALRNLDLGPAVGALKLKLQTIAEAEFERQRHRLGALTEEQERAVRALLSSTINKVSHPIITRIRGAFESGDGEQVQSWLHTF